LRCNFVAAAPKGPHSSVFARLVPPWRRAFYEVILSQTFYEFMKRESNDFTAENAEGAGAKQEITIPKR